jgi:hypothetical protein
MGTLAAGLSVLLLVVGDVSFVVHFLPVVRYGNAVKLCWVVTNFLRLLSETMHSTSSSRQFVQGAPCSTTLQRTFLERQHWHALEALLLTLFGGRMPLRPASDAVRFEVEEWTCIVSAGGDDDESDRLQSIGSIVTMIPVCFNPVQCSVRLALLLRQRAFQKSARRKRRE